MRVAIIGCGQFSRAHIRALQALPGLEIVAVCDQDPWRAKEVASLTRGGRPYGDLAALLQHEHPEVVHVLTPPSTHASLAIQAVEKGCHVLVEKPMALSTEEAERMITAARTHGVTLATDHNYLFNPCILKARRLVKQDIVGQVVYVEGYYGLSETAAYTSIAGRSHWAWRLPGSAFTNFLPHVIYLLLEFLPGEVSVAGVHLTSGAMPTELAVLLRGGAGASGVMSISMRARPYAKFLNIHGTKGMVHADLATEVCTLHKARQLPGMLTKVLFNFEESVQLAAGTAWNTARVLLGNLKRDPGLHQHLRTFYASLRDGKEPPVPGEAGKRMVALMEQIWAKLPHAPAIDLQAPRGPAFPQTAAERLFAQEGVQGPIAVTGATGFLGYHLVLALVRCGAQVVCLVRDPNRVPAELKQCAQIVRADLRDSASLEAALRNVAVVYHCAAVTKNSLPWQTHHDVNIDGTKALLAASLAGGVQRVVHVSSVIIYGLAPPSGGEPIAETTPLPTHPDRWAHYQKSKSAADALALNYWRDARLPVTVLRLGILYGPGGRVPGRGLLQLGSLRFTLGNGRNTLPFTYVGNAVDCMLLAAITPAAVGQAFNVVDDPQVTARDVVGQTMQITGERCFSIPLPKFFLSGIAALLEWKSQLAGDATPPKLSRFVVKSACRNLCYDTTKARSQLRWQSAVTLSEGLRKTLNSCHALYASDKRDASAGQRGD